MPTTAPNMSGPVDIYATDEDVYVAAPGDFVLVVPKSSTLASGSDGVINPGTPWAFTSASNNFQAQGVTPGMILQLEGTPGVFKRPQTVAIDSVVGNVLTLHRCGFAIGQGMPPGPPAGATGISFTIASLYPQLEAAAFELDQQFAVDPNLPNRQPGNMTDQRIFRRMTALWVMIQLLISENRSGDDKGDWEKKIKRYQDLYDTALATATVRWGPTGTSQESTTRFSCRLER